MRWLDAYVTETITRDAVSVGGRDPVRLRRAFEVMRDADVLRRLLETFVASQLPAELVSATAAGAWSTCGSRTGDARSTC